MIKYTLKRLDRPHHQIVQVSDIITLLEEANDVFTASIGQIKVAEVTKGFIPHYSHVMERLDKHGNINVDDVPYNEFGALESTNELIKLIATNCTTIELAGRDPDNLAGVIVVWAEARIRYIEVRKAIIDITVTCPKCHEILENVNVDHHQLTSACFGACWNEQIEFDGLVQIDEEDEIEVVQSKYVKSFVRASAHSLYAPKWVESAIETFKKNRFAGLTLHEYLDKMSGSKNG